MALNRLHGTLPSDVVALDVNVEGLGSHVEESLGRFDPDSFTEDALWRDWLCLTKSIRTFNRRASIARTWSIHAPERKPTNFKAGTPRVSRLVPGSSWVDVPFTFTTQPKPGLTAVCSGTASLVPAESSWKFWMLTTILEYFQGHGNPDIPRQPAVPAVTTPAPSEQQLSVIIIGAGQNGLALAGRLGALNVDYIVLDRSPAIGHSWTGEKYSSTRLHTVKEMNNMPFDRTFLPEDPLWLPAATYAQGLQRYADKYSINLSLSTAVDSCAWDAEAGRWRVTVQSTQGGGQQRTIMAPHLAIGIGAGNTEPSMPQYPGQDQYQGICMHSSTYRHSDDWSGRSAIIVGSSTSAHDIAGDMLDAGLSSVTMVQRGKTAIFPIEWLERGMSSLYNTTIPTGVADRMGAMPIKIGRDLTHTPVSLMTRRESERFDALERAGFRVDRDSGLHDLGFSRSGGYYIDVGTSARIAEGGIKVISDVPIDRFTSSGLAFADGTEVSADVVIFATGYTHDYSRQVASLVGKECASKMGQFWKMDDEGELKGVMKPIAPGLWLLGGGPMHARWYSRFIALQLQGERLGISIQQPEPAS